MIQRKRPAFRGRVRGLRPGSRRGPLASLTSTAVADAGIVRHRGKIESRSNAQATVGSWRGAVAGSSGAMHPPSGTRRHPGGLAGDDARVGRLANQPAPRHRRRPTTVYAAMQHAGS
jgi:hypothetical protein